MFTDKFEESNRIFLEIESLKEYENIDEENNEENEEKEENQDRRDDEQQRVNENIPDVRPQRNRKLPEKLKDYVDDNFEDFVLLNEEEIPNTYEDCLMSKDKEGWKKVINDEKLSLKKMNAWDFVDEEEARGKEIISSRWIFKEKADGIKKARLVA